MHTPPVTLRPRAAAAYLGIGLSTIWRRAKEDPAFPKPRKLGGRVTVFLRADLDGYVSRCGNGEG